MIEDSIATEAVGHEREPRRPYDDDSEAELAAQDDNARQTSLISRLDLNAASPYLMQGQPVLSTSTTARPQPTTNPKSVLLKAKELPEPISGSSNRAIQNNSKKRSSETDDAPVFDTSQKPSGLEPQRKKSRSGGMERRTMNIGRDCSMFQGAPQPAFSLSKGNFNPSIERGRATCRTPQEDVSRINIPEDPEHPSTSSLLRLNSLAPSNCGARNVFVSIQSAISFIPVTCQRLSVGS